MSNYNYNPNKEDLVIAGIKVKDYGEDVKFTISYEEDFKSVVTGTDGDSVTVEHNNRNAIITVNILPSSPLNILFTELAFKEGDFSVMTTDRNWNGDIGNFTDKAHFIKVPDKKAEKSPKSREWQVRAINLKPSLKLVEDLL